MRDYAIAEKNSDVVDVVLVGIKRIKILKKAYQNYFTDTAEFLKKIEMIKKIIHYKIYSWVYF